MKANEQYLSVLLELLRNLCLTILWVEPFMIIGAVGINAKAVYSDINSHYKTGWLKSWYKTKGQLCSRRNTA